MGRRGTRDKCVQLERQVAMEGGLAAYVKSESPGVCTLSFGQQVRIQPCDVVLVADKDPASPTHPTGKIMNSCMARPLPAWLPPLMMLNEGTGRYCRAEASSSLKRDISGSECELTNHVLTAHLQQQNLTTVSCKADAHKRAHNQIPWILDIARGRAHPVLCT